MIDTPQEPIFRGLLPMRRIIVIAFIGAAFVGGIVSAKIGLMSPMGPILAADKALAPAASPDHRVINRNGNVLNTVDQDGDHWQCAGTIGPESCTQSASSPGAPVQPLGYFTAAIAERACSDGEVVPLWRQGEIVGYGCLIDWRDSLATD